MIKILNIEKPINIGHRLLMKMLKLYDTFLGPVPFYGRILVNLLPHLLLHPIGPPMNPLNKLILPLILIPTSHLSQLSGGCCHFQKQTNGTFGKVYRILLFCWEGLEDGMGEMLLDELGEAFHLLGDWGGGQPFAVQLVFLLGGGVVVLAEQGYLGTY